MFQGEHYLYIDVVCGKCNRLIAMTNAFHWRGQYLCPQCAPSMEEVMEDLCLEHMLEQ